MATITETQRGTEKGPQILKLGETFITNNMWKSVLEKEKNHEINPSEAVQIDVEGLGKGIVSTEIIKEDGHIFPQLKIQMNDIGEDSPQGTVCPESKIDIHIDEIKSVSELKPNNKIDTYVIYRQNSDNYNLTTENLRQNIELLSSLSFSIISSSRS
jgi:hypothetical protein